MVSHSRPVAVFLNVIVRDDRHRSRNLGDRLLMTRGGVDGDVHQLGKTQIGELSGRLVCRGSTLCTCSPGRDAQSDQSSQHQYHDGASPTIGRRKAAKPLLRLSFIQFSRTQTPLCISSIEVGTRQGPVPSVCSTCEELGGGFLMRIFLIKASGQSDLIRAPVNPDFGQSLLSRRCNLYLLRAHITVRVGIAQQVIRRPGRLQVGGSPRRVDCSPIR